MTPATRAASATLNEIIVELKRMREWFDWMKPIPPMSAARLKHQSHGPSSNASLHLSGHRRSRFLNSSQNSDGSMYSFSFQSTPRTKWPSAFRRFDRCEAMKPPAPVTMIRSLPVVAPPGPKPSVNFFSLTGGSGIDAGLRAQ